MPTVTKPPAQAKTLSNRTFGLIFAAIFAVIGLLPLIGAGGVRFWALYLAGGFAVVSLLFPAWLVPLNKLWVKFGQMMHKITNPLLMGLVFFLTVFPTGMILRLFGKDPMRRKKVPDTASYWIQREQNAITPEAFDQQF